MAKDQNISERPSTQPSIEARRDAQGRFQERAVRLGTQVEIRRYAYDSAGRLVRVVDERDALCESYPYDPQGRRQADICPECGAANGVSLTGRATAWARRAKRSTATTAQASAT